jgi:PKHD-type hydroxylase
MANTVTWFFSQLPDEITDLIARDLDKISPPMDQAGVGIQDGSVITEIRNNRNSWVSTSHWMGGLMWHYIEKTNRENYLYDLIGFEGETLQYSEYREGEYYTWHVDAGLPACSQQASLGVGGCDQVRAHEKNLLNSELVRKLSFSLQLSSPEEYEGGQLQFLGDEGNSFFAPKQKGTVVIFDSRTRHRVRKVTKGVRKSLVGWVLGPRWK